MIKKKEAAVFSTLSMSEFCPMNAFRSAAIFDIPGFPARVDSSGRAYFLWGFSFIGIALPGVSSDSLPRHPSTLNPSHPLVAMDYLERVARTPSNGPGVLRCNLQKKITLRLLGGATLTLFGTGGPGYQPESLKEAKPRAMTRPFAKQKTLNRLQIRGLITTGRRREMNTTPCVCIQLNPSL